MFLVLIVTDTGVGLSKENAKFMFKITGNNGNPTDTNI